MNREEGQDRIFLHHALCDTFSCIYGVSDHFFIHFDLSPVGHPFPHAMDRTREFWEIVPGRAVF